MHVRAATNDRNIIQTHTDVGHEEAMVDCFTGSAMVITLSYTFVFNSGKKTPATCLSIGFCLS